VVGFLIRYPFTLGIALWLLHGSIRNDTVIIVANEITFSLSLANADGSG
jgi:hypothetical protein